jgi:hypothetical protein
MVIGSPTEKTEAGTVMPPVVILTCLAISSVLRTCEAVLAFCCITDGPLYPEIPEYPEIPDPL